MPFKEADKVRVKPFVFSFFASSRKGGKQAGIYTAQPAVGR
jgi:hypothetical protein